MPSGGFRATNITLRELISYAYKLHCFDECRDFISGGPDWIASSRYDIQARPPKSQEKFDHSTASQPQNQLEQLVRQRVQALLADRFQLVLRSDTKEGSTYALRIARNGHKLKPGTGESAVQGGDFSLTAKNTSMEGLVVDLTSLLGRPVVDKTGLTGGFDFNLAWSPPPDVRASDVAGQSIFGALHSQLGLKLEPLKGPVTKLIVVRAERPSEN